MLSDRFLEKGEYAAAGLFEEQERSLFYRNSLGLRRFYEHCALPEYVGKKLYPYGFLPSNMNVKPHYEYGFLNGMPSFTQLNYLIDTHFKMYKSHIPSEHTVGGNMSLHSMPHYDRILAEGLLSYVPRIEKIEDKDMREGLIHVVEGIKAWIYRMVEYLKSVNADEKLIAALKKVPLYPATNIYEALVSWNVTLYLDGCDNIGSIATGLMPYYNGEDITEHLAEIFDNLNDNNGYSLALHTNYNPITLQCLEASKGKRRPMIELFVDETTPDEVWEKAIEVVKTGGGQPAFYNPKVLLGGLKEKFSINEEDLSKFCGGGCTESMIAGLSNVGSIDAGIHLLLILEETIYKHLEDCKSFDEFYDIYISKTRKIVDKVTDAISASQIDRAKYNPLPMRTLLVDDCIDTQTEFNAGGARYKWSIISFPGIVNVIDSMLVIRDFVFKDKKYTASELISALRANDTAFLTMAKHHKVTFGTGNPDADAFAKKISTEIYSMLDGKKPAIGEAFLPASILFMTQASAGSLVGATPDGREKCTPIADSISAILGKDIKGPTALLQSVTSLNHDRALGVPVLNFNINPDIDSSILKSLILGYIKLGGIQMQISCVSKETLLKAYDDPDSYRNLVVRVGGYSEYFYRLDNDTKKMVINRTIQQI